MQRRELKLPFFARRVASMYVASHAEAWIEIAYPNRLQSRQELVASHAEAWIEILIVFLIPLFYGLPLM